MIKKDILFDNPSPTSGFPSQTINLGDLSKYFMIKIVSKNAAGGNQYNTTTIYRFANVQKHIALLAIPSGYLKACRTYQLTWNTGNLLVSDARRANETNTTSLVPVTVYGFYGSTRSMI